MNEDFKLPGTSYDELVKIIKAYNQAKETSLEELQKLCGLSTSTISRNSGFLISSNIIEGGKIRTITNKGAELARALEYNVQDQIAGSWREIIKEIDFFQKMISAVKIRNGMDPQSFQSHIAYSSGQSKTSYTKIGSAAMIEILKTTQIIIESDGKLIYNEKEKAEEKEILTAINGVSSSNDKNNQNESEFPLKTRVKNNQINVNIDIKIIAKVSEIEELGVKLKNLLNKINLEISDEETQS